MATDPRYEPITADAFLAMDFGSDRRFELVDGVIQMMTGGSSFHAHVAGNIYVALRTKLANSARRPFNSDMGIRVDVQTVRYPDISVICRPDWLVEPDVKAYDDPIIVTVLSPSTTSYDQGAKLEEYRRLPSVDTIVLVDPINRLTRTIQRQGQDQWRDGTFAQPHDVHLPALSITLTEAEIFARG